jgi:hypothetical protein
MARRLYSLRRKKWSQRLKTQCWEERLPSIYGVGGTVLERTGIVVCGYLNCLEGHAYGELVNAVACSSDGISREVQLLFLDEEPGSSYWYVSASWHWKVLVLHTESGMAYKMATVIFYKMVNILTILFYFILHRLASWPSGPSRYMMLPSHSIASQSDSVFKHTILTRSAGKFSSISSPQADRRTFSDYFSISQYRQVLTGQDSRTGRADRQQFSKYFNILTIWHWTKPKQRE